MVRVECGCVSFCPHFCTCLVGFLKSINLFTWVYEHAEFLHRTNNTDYTAAPCFQFSSSLLLLLITSSPFLFPPRPRRVCGSLTFLRYPRVGNNTAPPHKIQAPGLTGNQHKLNYIESLTIFHLLRLHAAFYPPYYPVVVRKSIIFRLTNLI